MDNFVKALRACSGGESVVNGHTETACSYCSNGRCIELPLCEAPPPLTEAERAEWRKARIATITTPFD